MPHLPTPWLRPLVSTLTNVNNGVWMTNCAADVQCKVVAPRKAGKEGPVVDCIACSVTSVLYGMRLRSTVET